MVLKVNGYAADQLDQALDGVKVVVIPAGVPRKVFTIALWYISQLTLLLAARCKHFYTRFCLCTKFYCR